ncbi:MAG: serine protease [Acidobacteriaceae bacterium]|nr:serine protease [Acidobacteriaceae bacterium]
MSRTGTSELSALSRELADVVARTVKGVVAIKAAPYRAVSGVAIAADLVAVADHALKRAERIPIGLSDGKQASATILGRDPTVDLAILRVEGETLNPLPAADTEKLETGSLVEIVGFTFDVGPTASLGALGAVGPARRTWRGGTLDRFIRLDVNLYPSQSGAAAVDADGRLIGMATPALSRHSVMAVPVATLQRVANELVKEGRIRRGYLGTGVQTVVIPASLRQKTGLDTKTGLMLLSVEPDSPAARAGLQLGDILLSLGATVTSDVEDLQDALRGDAVGRSAEAVLIRGGERVSADIVIGERAASRERGERGE